MLSRPSSLRRADEELHATQERLTLALEAAGLSVWDWDIPSGALTFEPPIATVLGYPDVDVPLHAEGRSLTHPDDVQAFDAAYQAHVRGETPRLDSEFRMRHHDGSWRWIHCRGEIVARATDGTPSRVVGTFADVTEPHEEAEDRRFLTDLTTAMAQASDPASVINIALEKLARHLRAERAGVSELNSARDTFITRAVWSHQSLPPSPSNHRTAYASELIDAACEGDLVINDMWVHPYAGHEETAELYRKMDIRAVLNIPMQAEGRKPLFFFVHARTPRHWTAREVDLAHQVAERLWNAVGRARAEVVRQSSDELLGMAMKLARIGAFERNIATGHVRMSDEFFEILGHPEISSGTLVDYMTIIHPDDLEKFQAKFAAARAAGAADREINDEHRIITSTGDIRHVVYKSRTHFEDDAEGVSRLVRAAAVIQDVTEQKKQAEEAASARDRLNKMARLTAMGTMASTLAHELNQPLAAATNYLNVLRTLSQGDASNGAVDPAQVLELAARSVLDAGKIIKKIRRFTSGGGLQRQPEDVDALIDTAVRGLREQFGAASPAIDRHIPQPLRVQVDALQMEQVLSNLLRNAAEAMAGQEDGRITINASEVDDSVVLRVADNGPGIADDFAAGLFSPFQSSKHDGLGLGLSLCRTMVEAHGGHLTLEKHDSTGCTFVVQLPKAARRARPERGARAA